MSGIYINVTVRPLSGGNRYAPVYGDSVQFMKASPKHHAGASIWPKQSLGDAQAALNAASAWVNQGKPVMGV